LATFNDLDCKDSGTYDWNSLASEYPAVNVFSSIQHWMNAFRPYKSNAIPDTVLSEFRTYCEKIKEDKKIQINMLESKLAVVANNMRCEVLTGDCTILDKVIKKDDYSKCFLFYFNDHH
jgi:hypothetical protein